MIVWVRAVSAVLALILAAATFVPFIATDQWLVRFSAFPRVQVLVLLVVLLLAMLALPGRLRPVWLAVEGATVAAIAAQVWVLYPFIGWHDPEMVAAVECPEGHRLEVVAVNVQMTNENADRLFETLADADPDLILLQETDPWWDERLKALADEYPYAVQHVTQNYFGIHLLSRFPLAGAEVRFLTSSRDPSVFTGVTLPSGDAVRFYGIHPRPPAVGQSTAERDGQILAAALAVRQDGQPSVLAGDLNSPPWSMVLGHARRVAGLLEPRIGRGWTPTFGAQSPVVAWPLDYVLAGDAFTVLGYGALPAFGSDHLPVLAELCFQPSAAALQSAPELGPDDIAAAEAAVRRGQNKAESSPEPAPGKQTPAAQ